MEAGTAPPNLAVISRQKNYEYRCFRALYIHRFLGGFDVTKPYKTYGLVTSMSPNPMTFLGPWALMHRPHTLHLLRDMAVRTLPGTPRRRGEGGGVGDQSDPDVGFWPRAFLEA